MTTTTDKRYLYKTAVAKLACARVKLGDVVRVSYEGYSDGAHWYAVTATERGSIETVMYPEAHLERFVL